MLLSRVDVQIDPADYARQSRQLCQGEVTDVDAGDVAFACVMGLGPQGQLYAGQVLVTVAVNDAVDDAAGIAAAAALLPEVTVPLRPAEEAAPHVRGERARPHGDTLARPHAVAPGPPPRSARPCDVRVREQVSQASPNRPW